MGRRQLQLITAPGLPPWPKLYLDRRRRVACVIARHPTWRSYEWAFRATALLNWLVFIPVVYCLWLKLFQFEPAYRLLILFFGSCFLFPLVSAIVRHSTTGFLARQIFPTKTEFWASRHAIVFRSRFYRKPVIIWRTWKDQQVKTKFILNRDPDAERRSMDRPNAQRQPRSHLNEAMVLELVVAAVDATTTIASRDQFLQRTIPLTEVSSRLARKFTMVFAAAVMLTAKNKNQTNPRTFGIDIDSQ